MKIGGIYSLKGGKKIVEAQFAAELQEIKAVITAVDGPVHKTKVSQEKTMPGKMLYKPGSLNKEMSTGVSYFEQFIWDLEHRGTADIDIPVLILGITV